MQTRIREILEVDLSDIQSLRDAISVKKITYGDVKLIGIDDIEQKMRQIFPHEDDKLWKKQGIDDAKVLFDKI